MRIDMLMRRSSGIVEARESLAAATMRLASDPGGCLVVMDGGRFAGVLTPADAWAAGPSTVPSLALHEFPALSSRLTVADAMHRDPVVVAPDATPAEVARALRTRGHRAAIVADGAEILGVVTATDLFGALVARLEQETPPRLLRLLVAVSLAAAPRRRSSMHTALDVALAIARRHGAMLTLLHVARGLSPRIAEGLPAGVDADMQRWRLAQARAALESLVPREDRSMTRVDVRAGDVVEGVLASAATTGADLIVMGGQPGGAVVRETIRRAPCPVLAA